MAGRSLSRESIHFLSQSLTIGTNLHLINMGDKTLRLKKYILGKLGKKISLQKGALRADVRDASMTATAPLTR